jgi:type VI secretion system protein ImpI
MEIVLTVENAENLPDGAQAAFRARARGFGVGRADADWTLPDPEMIVSGRHCDIRFDPASGFWLEDVSRNGTYINGSRQRLAEPYLLKSGDRLRIGRYIVQVAVDAGELPPVAAPAAPERYASGSNDFMAPVDTSPAYPPPRPSQQQADIPAPSGRRILSPGPPPGQADILREIAAGAGISPEVFQSRDAREVAAEIGVVLRIVVEELSAMLKARAAARMMTRSGHQTMISSAGNNPLKFVPGAEEMLEKMFSRRSAGYLDAKGSLEDAFRDLKTHEIATYAAMQAALSRLMEELSPETIEKRVAPSSFGSKRGRSWDAFVKAWETREQAHENGMLDVFLAYFSESYASASKQRK